jgi:putative hydroxymethylpyrimidine transport system ATP-binding protein
MDGAGQPDAPRVRVEHATVEFDGVRLIDDLGVTLEAGRCTCLLGPSGVGKTTVLRLVAGLVDAGASRACVSCDDGEPLIGRVAYMAQQDLLMPWLDLEGNVLLGLRLRGQPIDRAARERARALLADLGLGDRCRSRPAELSGGMRQRAALARTLFEDRPVVLMDEPFSALDAITRHRLQEPAATHLRGRTVLLITHDPMEALRLGHVVHVLRGRPARLGDALRPQGMPPRAADRADVLQLYGELLERLDEADQVRPC